MTTAIMLSKAATRKRTDTKYRNPVAGLVPAIHVFRADCYTDLPKKDFDGG
jgi:hypothetical protein